MDKNDINGLTDGSDARIVDQLRKDIARFQETGKLPEDNYADCRVIKTESDSPYWDWVEKHQKTPMMHYEWEPSEANPDLLVDQTTEEPAGTTRHGERFFVWIHGGGPENLPENQRFVFERHFVAGIGQDEVAEEMGISQGHVSKLVKKIKERIEKEVGM